MQRNLFISFSFFILALININATSKIPTPTNTANTLSVQKIITRADIEKKIGRRFTFKERVSWLLIKNKINNPDTTEKKPMSKASKILLVLGAAALIGYLIFGVLGVLGIFFGFTLLNINFNASSKEPKDLEYTHEYFIEKEKNLIDPYQPNQTIKTTKEEEKMLNQKIKDAETAKRQETSKKVLLIILTVVLGIALGLLIFGFIFSEFIKILLGVR